jgi:hypothetical protein
LFVGYGFLCHKHGRLKAGLLVGQDVDVSSMTPPRSSARRLTPTMQDPHDTRHMVAAPRALGLV